MKLELEAVLYFSRFLVIMFPFYEIVFLLYSVEYTTERESPMKVGFPTAEVLFSKIPSVQVSFSDIVSARKVHVLLVSDNILKRWR